MKKRPQTPQLLPDNNDGINMSGGKTKKSRNPRGGLVQTITGMIQETSSSSMYRMMMQRDRDDIDNLKDNVKRLKTKNKKLKKIIKKNKKIFKKVLETAVIYNMPDNIFPELPNDSSDSDSD